MDHAGDTRIHSTSLAVAIHSGRDAEEARRRAKHDAAVEARQHAFMSRIEASNPDAWLYKAATLMRACLAVQRQVRLDTLTARTARQAAGRLSRPYRARLQLPAVLLAALAVESALKGAIVARGGMATGHDLVRLARRARVEAGTPAELEALESGKRCIEELGGSASSGSDLCAAYRALFLRAVGAAARATWKRTEHLRSVSRRAYAAEEIGVYRMFIEGVYAPTAGEEGLDLF